MPSAGFESSIRVNEQPKTHVSDREVTGIGTLALVLRSVSWGFFNSLSTDETQCLCYRHYQYVLKCFIVHVLASATQLFIVVIKTITGFFLM
jgi:hypothetical protein